MKKKKISKFIIYSILILGVIIVIYPFFYMVINSFKEGPDIMHNPTALPKKISFDGYISIFKTLNIGRLFFNSFFISASVAFLNVVLSSMVAYGIVKSGLKHKNLLLSFILGTMMIPGILLLIPTYMMLYEWDWINTYKALIIPSMVTAYNVFLMIQFMKQLDDAYLEAARIDGANEFKVFTRVVLPMVKPALATLTILTFMGAWNDFLGPLLYLRDESKMTLQLALFNFQSEVPGENAQQIWAATTMITLPVTLLFFSLQKSFIKAFTGVGLK